jgi:hypothetical protein
LRAAVATVLLLLAAPAVAAPSPDLASVSLKGGPQTPLLQQIRSHKLTVITFFAASCPCFAAHAERLRALVQELGPRGVEVLVVDSERHRPTEVVPAIVPGTSLPVLRDDGATLAHRLGAKFATESFVFDQTGALRYHGGIDSDRKYLSDHPRQSLREALLGLLAGSAPDYVSSKSLGCALRLL